MSVNVASQQEVSFTLVYQELLERHLGIYEHIIYVDPGQLISDYQVKVNIDESRDIRFLRVPPLKSISNQTEKNSYKGG